MSVVYNIGLDRNGAVVDLVDFSVTNYQVINHMIVYGDYIHFVTRAAGAWYSPDSQNMVFGVFVLTNGEIGTTKTLQGMKNSGVELTNMRVLSMSVNSDRENDYNWCIT